MTIPVRQASWATVEYLAYPLFMFALAPFFVRKLGVHHYGLWMMLVALSSLGGVAGLGMGVTATREIAALRGRGEQSRTGEIMRICVVVSLCGCIVLAAIYGLSWSLLPDRLLERIGAHDEVLILLVASTVVVLFEQLDAVFAGAIRGAERFDLSSRAEILAKLSALGLCAICASLSTSLPLFLGVVALGAALRAAVKAVIAKWVLGPSWFSGRPRWRNARSMAGFGGWIWVQSFGSFLFAAADRLLIGSLLGSSAVAVYAMLVQLAQQIHTIPSAGASVLYPLVSRMRAQGASVERPVRSAILGTVAVAVLLAFVVWIAGDRIIQWWMGDAFASMGKGTLAVLAMAYLMLAICVVPHYLLLALGHARLTAILNLGAGLAAVVFCWLAVPVSGLQGAAWSKVVYASVLIVGIMACARMLHDSKGRHPVHGEAG